MNYKKELQINVNAITIITIVTGNHVNCKKNIYWTKNPTHVKPHSSTSEKHHFDVEAETKAAKVRARLGPLNGELEFLKYCLTCLIPRSFSDSTLKTSQTTHSNTKGHESFNINIHREAQNPSPELSRSPFLAGGMIFPPPSGLLDPCQSSSNNWKLISFNTTLLHHQK